LFIAVPLALAAAIGLEPGEKVQWQLRSRQKLNLLRQPPTPAKHRGKR